MLDSTDSVPPLNVPDGTRNHPIPRRSERIAFGIVRSRLSARTAERRDRLVESSI